MKKLRFDGERKQFILFLLLVFSVYSLWALILPVGAAPDEDARFLIPQYIYQHGSLPTGWDPEVRMNLWGFSYAFYPYLSGIVSALFMKITSYFTTNADVLYVAARFASVIFGTVKVYFCYRLSRELFQGVYQWLFVGLVTFLPQAVFCSAYINNEAIAVASISMIVYYWFLGIKMDWPVALCVKLGIALSICFLSYYNAYGFILMTAVLFIFCAALQGKGKICWKPLFSKGFLIVGVAALFAGWWFVRQIILYDGDILGRTSLNLCGEMYASPEYRPSVHLSFRQQGYSLWMTLSKRGLVANNGNWFSGTYQSFIGVFGVMEFWMPDYCYRLYTLVFGMAGIGLVLKIKAAGELFKQAFRKKDVLARNRVFFYLALLTGVFITAGLAVYYTYTSEFQAQGRYLFPALVPVMLFVTMGLQSFLKTVGRLVKTPKLERWCAGGVFIFIILMQIFALETVVLPIYI